PPGSSPEPMRVPGSRRSPPVTRSTLGNPRPGRSSPSTSITGRTGRRRHDAENRWPDPVAWKSTATTEHPSRPHPRRATEEVKALHRILSTQLQAHTGQTVRLAGWVHRRRLLKSVAFLILRDRTGLAQIVVPQGKQLPPEETVIEVTGTVVANPVAPGGAEIVDPTVTALAEPAAPLPFDLYRPELTAALPVQ